MSKLSYVIKFKNEDCYKIGYIRSGTLNDKLKNYPEYDVVYTKNGYDPYWEKSILNDVIKYVPKVLKDKSGRQLSGATSKFFILPTDTTIEDIINNKTTVILYRSTIDNSEYYLSSIELTTNVDIIYQFNTSSKQALRELMYQAKTRVNVLNTYDNYFSFRLLHKDVKSFISELNSIKPLMFPTTLCIFKVSEFYSVVLWDKDTSIKLPSSELVYKTRVEKKEAKDWLAWVENNLGLDIIVHDDIKYSNCFFTDSLEAVINKTYTNKTKILSQVLALLENLNDVDDIKALVKVHMS